MLEKSCFHVVMLYNSTKSYSDQIYSCLIKMYLLSYYNNKETNISVYTHEMNKK